MVIIIIGYVLTLILFEKIIISVSCIICLLIIINVMKLLYEKYFDIIGNFCCYNILDRIYKITKSKSLQEQIKQLFYLSLSTKISDDEIKENNLNDIKKEDINYIKIS